MQAADLLGLVVTLGRAAGVALEEGEGREGEEGARAGLREGKERGKGGKARQARPRQLYYLPL